MINYYSVRNFKSLKNVHLNLSNLNLFMGLNSMGKSSVIQSLLMLRQSYIKNNNFNRLHINGELISLGNSNDIFFQNADLDECIEFKIKNKDSFLNVLYKYKDSVTYLNSEKLESGRAENLSIFNDDFHYLAADHISPSKTYKSEISSVNDYNVLGNNGENAPFWLSRIGKNELVNNLLHHEKAKSNLISHELDAWLSEISPGAKVLAEAIQGLELVQMTVQFETKHQVSESKFIKEYTNTFSPKNVGFGIPYVLPLILTLITSNPGDIVLIENPESHLHPRGQAELGRLIALAAQSGVQIICETHSDHVINGIRVAAKNGTIQHENIRFFYFEKNKDTQLETEVTTISIDRNGELDNYPEGLLDEWGNLMSQLF